MALKPYTLAGFEPWSSDPDPDGFHHCTMPTGQYIYVHMHERFLIALNFVDFIQVLCTYVRKNKMEYLILQS
jgi:hypothetical protein